VQEAQKNAYFLLLTQATTELIVLTTVDDNYGFYDNHDDCGAQEADALGETCTIVILSTSNPTLPDWRLNWDR
jgi:hypothetical protein